VARARRPRGARRLGSHRREVLDRDAFDSWPTSPRRSAARPTNAVGPPTKIRGRRAGPDVRHHVTVPATGELPPRREWIAWERAIYDESAGCRRPHELGAISSMLALRSDWEQRRLGTHWRTHTPCRLPGAGSTRRPCAAAPWVSSRSSSARICFSSASETRLRLAYAPQAGHVPTSPAQEKRQPQKQATSISDRLRRPAVVPADASSGL